MPEKQDLKGLLENDSFLRWINNEANKQEQDYWLKWMRQDPTRKELVEQAHELITVAGLSEPIMPELEPEEELKRLENSLDQMDAQSGTYHFRKIYQRSGTIFGAVAAGLLMLIIVLGFLFMGDYGSIQQEDPAITKSKQEFRTDYGEKISLNLSDGSEIILNANSHLKYLTTVKQGQDIEVWLKGEAYFDISHFEDSKQRSFTVYTSDGAVEVLGTQFVIKTDPKGTQTVLQKGKIRIKVDADTLAKGKEQLKEVTIAPGELAYFSSEVGRVERSEVNTRVYTSWIKETWVFDKTPLKQVANRIEDTFDVEVEIAHPLQTKILSGSIKSTNLDFLQQALSEVINEPVTKRGNKVYIGEK